MNQHQPFKVIGIGAGFSPTLEANVCEASRMALFFEATLVLIHVGDPAPEKVATLEKHLAPFTKEGLKYELVFRPGEPVASILSATKDHNVDLLIIGAAQRENVLNYYVGSIARKITRKAQCSILLLIKPSVDRIPSDHIIVNGLEDVRTKDTIATAFYVGHKLAASRITIVEEIKQREVTINVDDDATLRKATLQKEKLRRREEKRVQQILSEVPDAYKQDINITTQPIFGQRGYSIGHYAEVVRADLLIMNATKKMSFWDRLFPHDIEHILTELPTDVLIIQ